MCRARQARNKHELSHIQPPKTSFPDLVLDIHFDPSAAGGSAAGAAASGAGAADASGVTTSGGGASSGGDSVVDRNALALGLSNHAADGSLLLDDKGLDHHGGLLANPPVIPMYTVHGMA